MTSPWCEHDQPLRRLHDGLHHVLHPEEPDPALVADAPQDRGRPCHLGGGEPGQQLVEQDDARPERERHGQLEQLAPAAGEPPRGHRRVLVHLDERRAARRASPPGRSLHSAAAATFSAAVRSRNGRGVWNVRPEAEPRDPVRGQGADPVLAEPDRARRWPEQPADQVEQRRLAGPVGPDERHDLAFGDREAHPRQDAEAPEAPGDVRAFEDHPPCACSSSEPPTIMAIASRRIHVNGSWNSRKPASRTSTVEVPPMKNDEVTFSPRS